MAAPHLMGQLLNILVRSLRLLRINHMYVMVFYGLSDISLYFIGIKDQNQDTLAVSLIIAENIHQLVPGSVYGNLSQLL